MVLSCVCERRLCRPSPPPPGSHVNGQVLTALGKKNSGFTTDKRYRHVRKCLPPLIKQFEAMRFDGVSKSAYDVQLKREKKELSDKVRAAHFCMLHNRTVCGTAQSAQRPVCQALQQQRPYNITKKSIPTPHSVGVVTFKFAPRRLPLCHRN